MKAWILSDRTGNDPYCSLVWADTVGKAKSLAQSSNGCMYQSDLEIEDWRNIRAVRCSDFDYIGNEGKLCVRKEDIYRFEESTIGNKNTGIKKCTKIYLSITLDEWIKVEESIDEIMEMLEYDE